MLRTCRKLKGSFAFVAMFDNSCLAGARYDEPLIIGLSHDGYFIASDVLGFLKHTDRATFLDNRDIWSLIMGKDVSLFNFDGEKVFRPITQVAWSYRIVGKRKIRSLYSEGNIRAKFNNFEDYGTKKREIADILQYSKKCKRCIHHR